MTARPRSIEN